MKRQRLHGWVSGLGGVLLLVWLTGCATIPGASKNLLDFLEIGRTTREEVILKLGQPSGAFEQERILTYRIGENDQQGKYVITPRSQTPPYSVPAWVNIRYSLVLIFDQNGKLEKQNLVVVN